MKYTQTRRKRKMLYVSRKTVSNRQYSHTKKTIIIVVIDATILLSNVHWFVASHSHQMLRQPNRVWEREDKNTHGFFFRSHLVYLAAQFIKWNEKKEPSYASTQFSSHNYIEPLKKRQPNKHNTTHHITCSPSQPIVTDLVYFMFRAGVYLYVVVWLCI